MKDYIDREYAIASLDRIKKRNARNHCVLSADEDAIKKWLMALPDSDVVEVVRCRDCKHSRHQYSDFHGTEKVVCWKDGYGIHKNANGYCDEGDFRNEKDGEQDG